MAVHDTALLLFLLVEFCAGGLHQTSLLSSYEITVPQRLSRERREVPNFLLTKDLVSYLIQIEGKEYVLHLEKNKGLLSKDFVVYTYGEDGALLSDRPTVKDHCHYQGYVDGVPGSRAAFSTCFGLRGMLHLENISYGVEPVESSSDFQHLIYRLENVQIEPMMCGATQSFSFGIPKENETDELHPPTMSQLLRRKRAILPQTRYVELFLVVDKDRYTMLNRNHTAVREEMVHLANYLDSMYITLNIRIVLVGLEIWTNQNMITTDGSAGDVLGRFVQWREKELVPRHRHDSAQFVLKQGFGGTAGMAFVGTVCSRSHAGGINVFPHNNVQSFASIVAHELGHNLGMNHDDGRSCDCQVAACIMNSGATGSKNFSSCSADDFEKLTLNKGGSCLLNVPSPDEAYTAPYCGNKLVDAGEECDCGSPKECEKDPCCEPKTCKRRSGTECAYGVCCKNCRYLPGGTECRSRANECDLPEYCNGSSPFCQPDVFIQNGHPCQTNKSYCYNGMCQFYDAQCKAIFGSKAKSAPEVCFREVNSKGDRFGHCGYHGSGFKTCDIRNSMCGKLQCENVDSPVFGISPALIQTPIHGTVCWGVDFRLGSDVPDPGMVNEGTKCEEGKICRGYQCVSASVLNYDCDIQMKCHGRGVCNSNKNCHCDSGWAFPNCEKSGYGGSTDSGPTYNDKDTSLRDGLLVFFFLIVPLILLGAFVFLKRNELKRRFCGKKRSQAYGQDERRGPDVAAQAVTVNKRPAANSKPKDTVVPPNRSAVPTYMVRQPQHIPSRPQLPHQKPPSGNLVPSRPAPLPPV
ncbi:disintegrin and metalloproteinase domain-containing protein 9 isoform X2 [Ambystoma mexicanum]|uniref:disintegrin and metalloproteinase domain-containing protein 9 isoform X2 n=1 Tax=Ambystoma mexicanum TaxID=8296 RepID=UPI0037E90E90